MDQLRVLGWIRKFHNLLTTHFLAAETFFSLKENGECKKKQATEVISGPTACFWGFHIHSSICSFLPRTKFELPMDQFFTEFTFLSK